MEFEHKWWALIGLSLLSFTAFLDFTIVSTALPFIQSALHTTMLQLQWVTNVFGMVLCMVMILAGRVGDILGRRKIFYFGFVIFLLAAIGAGLSSSIDMLIFFRGIQGFAAAIIFTLGVALLPQAFPEDEQAKAVGIFSAFNGAGLAIGPFLGGLLVHYLSWRWVFFVNIPVIVVGMLFCSFSLKESARLKDVHIDWLGFVLLAVGLGCVIYGIIHGEQSGWQATSSYVITLIGAVALVLLLIVESFVKHPLLDLVVFKNRLASMAVISCILAALVTFVFLFFDPLYLKFIHGYTAITIGLILLAIPIVQVGVSLALGKLIKKWGVFNLLIFGAFTGLLAAIFHAFFGATTSIVFLLVTMVLMGYTWGIANAGSITAIIQSVPGERIGGAIGTVFTFWNIAGSIFLAIGSAMFHHKETALAKGITVRDKIHLTATQHHQVAAALGDPEKIKQALSHFTGLMQHKIGLIFKSSFLHGYHEVAWGMAILMLVGLCLGLCLRKKRGTKPRTTQAG
jgi:EmrB/QacA subfamily drug resistance transporter